MNEFIPKTVPTVAIPANIIVNALPRVFLETLGKLFLKNNLQFYYTKYHSFSKPLLVKNTKSIFKILKMLFILI